MLLMRGGMLIMSPIVDTIFKRHVRWFSWVALGLSFMALVINNFVNHDPTSGWGISNAGFALNTIIIIDVVVYLAAYFIRLTFMTKLAKSDDPDVTKKYFVEEQMVGTPFLLTLLFIVSLFHTTTDATFIHQIHAGFTTFFTGHGTSIILIGIVIGICSQFTGVFGGLILLDKSENAFAVPVNRCSSILAGILATVLLVPVFNATLPPRQEFLGAACILIAILFLTIPPMIEKKRRAKKLTQQQ